MNHSKSESLCRDLGIKLNEIIPVEWDKIFLRSEVEIGTIELTYWFIDTKTGEFVQNFDMPSK